MIVTITLVLSKSIEIQTTLLLTLRVPTVMQFYWRSNYLFCSFQTNSFVRNLCSSDFQMHVETRHELVKKSQKTVFHQFQPLSQSITKRFEMYWNLWYVCRYRFIIWHKNYYNSLLVTKSKIRKKYLIHKYGI